MNNYKLVLELKSPTLIGSGSGFGAEIDTDIVFDELGLPYIPSKRIKGCLRDAIKEIEEMFSLAGVDLEKVASTKLLVKQARRTRRLSIFPTYISRTMKRSVPGCAILWMNTKI